MTFHFLSFWLQNPLASRGACLGTPSQSFGTIMLWNERMDDTEVDAWGLFLQPIS